MDSELWDFLQSGLQLTFFFILTNLVFYSWLPVTGLAHKVQAAMQRFLSAAIQISHF